MHDRSRAQKKAAAPCDGLWSVSVIGLLRAFGGDPRSLAHPKSARYTSLFFSYSVIPSPAG